MRLGDGVLQVPTLLRLLGEGNKLVASRDREDAEVLMLRAVLEFCEPFPGGDVGPSWREIELDNIWERKFSK